MADPNERELSVEKDQSKEKLDERKSDATSKETLSDIKQSEKGSGSSGGDRDPGPSPDGAFDEERETDKAGPM